jgi:8-oxo-dGTP diphosphatase
MPHIHDLYDFTASAFMLHPSEPKLCLLMHKKLQKWLQPGGHIELNENPLQALIRELEEETGLSENDWVFFSQPNQPKPNGNTTLPLPFHVNEHRMHGTDHHRHVDFAYLLQAKSDKLTDKPDGALSIGWFDIHQINEMHKNGDVYDGTRDICEWVLLRSPHLKSNHYPTT